jgi:hypothetical protein
MQLCPFCGAPESDRFTLDGRRFLVFPCQFSPEIDPALDEPALARWLAETFPAAQGNAYFRGMCDRLHLRVVREPHAAPE